MKALSLFGNIGIAELGLVDSNVNVVIYSELEKERVNLYKKQFNTKHIFQGDINKNKKAIINASLKEGIEFILATPPCQGSSIAGIRKKDDIRNLLIIPTLSVIKSIKPKYALIENVPLYFKDQIKYRGKYKKISEIIKTYLAKDFDVNIKILNAANHGVAQTRKRGFVFIKRKDVTPWPEIGTSKKITVKDVIGNLPTIQPICFDEPSFVNPRGSKIKYHNPTRHTKRHIEIMQHTPTGKSAFDNDIFFPKRKDGIRVKGFKTTYKRMDWDKPAPTITMSNKSISSQNNVHPGRKLKNGKYSNPRVLSLLEIMLLMTIPLDWKIPKYANEDKLRQYIGEGIPPMLVYQITKGFK